MSTEYASRCANPNTVTRSWEQLGKQSTAAVLCAAYSLVATVVLLKLINLFIPVVPSDAEGLDLHEHGEAAYTPTKPYLPGLQTPTQSQEGLKKKEMEAHSPLRAQPPPSLPVEAAPEQLQAESA